MSQRPIQNTKFGENDSADWYNITYISPIFMGHQTGDQAKFPKNILSLNFGAIIFLQFRALDLVLRPSEASFV